VNEFYSSPEFKYRERWITPLLQTAVAEHRVVVLTGARQVGKSTLLLNADPVKGWRYLSLDDFDVLRQAEEDPQALWAGADRVVIDEVQKAPALLPAVKQAVDRRPDMRFVLSGSANLLLMQRVSESLAGRAVYFVLAPMTLGEMEGTPPPDILSQLLAGQWPGEASIAEPSPDPFTLMLRGFMPALLMLERPEAWVRWWEGYVATYLERDLRQISQIDSLLDFHRVMQFLALRNGQLLNQSEVARDARISQPTVHRYLNLLETTYLLERFPAYTVSRTTRLIKSPKLYWADPGLVAFLAGYHDRDALVQAREAGAFFETLVLHHLRVLAQLMVPRGRLFYWRTATGREVDFVLEQGRRCLAFEVKLTTTPRYGDVGGLRLFLDQHPQAVGGVLIHNGQEIKRLDERIIALPWVLLAG
jgi:hypothetical protein